MSASRHVARALRSLRSQRRTLEQGLVALALSTLAGSAAGLILAHLSGTLEALPGLVVLIPAAVSMRGRISRDRLDPDDQSVPIITSAMDLPGVAAVILSMSLLGVLGSRA